MERKREKISFILNASRIKNHYDKYCRKCAKKFGLTLLEGELLTFMDYEGGRSTAGEMAIKSRASKSMISRTVDGLVKQGFIEAKTDENDRRYTILTLTPKAKPVIEAFKKAADEIIEKMLADISDDKLEEINTTIKTIADNLDEV